MAAGRWTTLRQAAALIAPGSRVLLGGCGGMPAALLDTVRADPDLWRDLTLTGAFVPGIDDADLTALGLRTRVETVFTTPGLASGAAAGRPVAHLPLHYSAFWARLARRGVVDWVVVTVPPPRADGTLGLGVCCDFAPAAIDAGARLIGIVNPLMPDAATGPRWPADRFAALAEGPADLPAYDTGPPDPVSRAIAAGIVALIPPGGTLQLGLGKLQRAVLEALAAADLPDLGFHAGMISGPILPLLEAGRFPRGVTTGVAVGPPGFAAAAAARPDVAFAPVGRTHDAAVLAALPGLIAVNSALEIDLAGQASAETAAGRQTSGQGGMVDFARGARASAGGRSILALPATARGGTVSRIVAGFAPGTPVSVARADVDTIVTEYGTADLREASAAERAERLVALAAPHHRDQLWSDWELRHRRSL